MQWHVLHDLTPPEVSIESASSANESDFVLVVVNATDSTSDLVELVELRATSPDGRVTVLDAGVNDSEFTVQPDSSDLGPFTSPFAMVRGCPNGQPCDAGFQPPSRGWRQAERAMVEHGDAFQVKLGQPLLLDASTQAIRPAMSWTSTTLVDWRRRAVVWRRASDRGSIPEHRHLRRPHGGCR